MKICALVGGSLSQACPSGECPTDNLGTTRPPSAGGNQADQGKVSPPSPRCCCHYWPWQLQGLSPGPRSAMAHSCFSCLTETSRQRLCFGQYHFFPTEIEPTRFYYSSVDPKEQSYMFSAIIQGYLTDTSRDGSLLATPGYHFDECSAHFHSSEKSY